MDNGYFGIHYADSQNLDGAGSFDTSYGAFYSTNGILTSENLFENSPNSVSIGIGDATWSGSAFGIEIASENPVFGVSILTFEEGNDLQANLLLDVDWNNGSSIQIPAQVAIRDDGTTLNHHEFVYSGTGNYFENRATLRGHFAGRSAEETFGVFDSQGYIGAFGAMRQ